MEQIEFVFLRWLVGALNSVLVALLIKAVKANLFSCEPGGDSDQPPDDTTYVCILSPQCSTIKMDFSSSLERKSIPGENNHSVSQS